MNYNSDESFRFAYIALGLVLAPLFILTEYTRVSWILLLSATIIASEYAYTFPRQAMKLYEKILFQSLLEKYHVAIQILVFISLGVTGVYHYETKNSLEFPLFFFVYLIWYYFAQKQSLIIGSESIAIGRRLFSYDSISSLSLKSEGLVIEVKDNTLSSFSFKREKLALEVKKKSFTIYNWSLGRNQDGLEAIVKEISEAAK